MVTGTEDHRINNIPPDCLNPFPSNFIDRELTTREGMKTSQRQVWLLLGITKKIGTLQLSLVAFGAICCEWSGRRLPRQLRISGHKYGSCEKGLLVCLSNGLEGTERKPFRR